MAPTIAPIVSPDDIPPGAVMCDVRLYLDGTDARAAYRASHIPGAIFVDMDAHLALPASPELGRHPMPSAEAFAQSMGGLGIGHDTVVVAYDDRDGMGAGRLVWMLRILGSPAALLDGGLQGWSGPLESGTNQLDPVDHPPRQWPQAKMVDADETAQLALADNAVVLDARAPERYRGETEPIDPRAGHIPGAVNAPFSANLSEGRFKDAAALADGYARLGVEPGADVVVYCGSGVSACHNLLALESIGIDARLYPGSWSQWSNDPNRPAATG